MTKIKMDTNDGNDDVKVIDKNDDDENGKNYDNDDTSLR